MRKRPCGILNVFSLWRDKLFTNETLYDHIIYVIVLIYLINCVRCFRVSFFKHFLFLLYVLLVFMHHRSRICVSCYSHGFAISFTSHGLAVILSNILICQHACSLWAHLYERELSVTLWGARSTNNSSNSRNSYITIINNNNKKKMKKKSHNINAYDADRTRWWSS